MPVFKVIMKTPDCLNHPINQICNQSVGTEEQELKLSNKLHEKCERWFRDGEYLTLEVDIDKMTCVVLEA